MVDFFLVLEHNLPHIDTQQGPHQSNDDSLGGVVVVVAVVVVVVVVVIVLCPAVVVHKSPLNPNECCCHAPFCSEAFVSSLEQSVVLPKRFLFVLFHHGRCNTQPVGPSP